MYCIKCFNPEENEWREVPDFNFTIFESAAIVAKKMEEKNPSFTFKVFEVLNLYVVFYKDTITNKFYRSRVRASDELRAMEVLRETINHPIEIEWVKDWTPKKPL